MVAGTAQGSKVHGANMGPTWVMSAPDGPHVGPMNLAIRVVPLCSQDVTRYKYIMLSIPTPSLYALTPYSHRVQTD